MTKKELIEFLQSSSLPDNTEIYIRSDYDTDYEWMQLLDAREGKLRIGEEEDEAKVNVILLDCEP